MDIQKYRKWYLQENWGENEFIMVKYRTRHPHPPWFAWPYRQDHLVIRGNNRTDLYTNHPMVNSGKAFWVTNNELCIGYELRKNPEIFRPIFSLKRQRFLDEVNKDIHNPIKFWNKVKSIYFMEIYKIKNLPIECINHIIMFTSK